MNILFTSDLHGEEAAFDQFGRLLSESEYDIGIVSGDLQEEYISKGEVIRLLNLSEDDMLDELPSEDPPGRVSWWGSENAKHAIAALEMKAQPLRERLQSANKPVLVVRGNHDKAAWKSGGKLTNLGQGYADIDGYRFVGYEHTEMTRSPEQQMRDIRALQQLMTSNTILVTHGPAYGVLDEMRIRDSQKGAITVHIGSKALSQLKKQYPPKLHLFGHVHSRFGVRGNCINGSYSPILRKMIRIERTAKGFIVKSVG